MGSSKEWFPLLFTAIAFTIVLCAVSLGSQKRKRLLERAELKSEIVNEVFNHLSDRGYLNVFQIAGNLALSLEEVRAAIHLLADAGLIEQWPDPGVKSVSDDHIPWGRPRPQLFKWLRKKLARS